MTWDEAKQKVAERHERYDWDDLIEYYSRGLHDDFYREVSELMQQSAANEAVKGYFQFRPVTEWDEEMGDCLFYRTPICEAPIVTCPLSSDWIEGYFTHFLEMKKFPVPDEDGSPIPGNSRNKYWTPFPEAK